MKNHKIVQDIIEIGRRLMGGIMKSKYGDILKELLKKPIKVENHILFIAILAMLLGGSIYSYYDSAKEVKNKHNNIEKFDSMGEVGEYGQLMPLYLTEPFAAEYDDSINYSFASDGVVFHIVAIGADDIEKYQGLIDYTYYETEQIPEAVVMKGISTEIPESIIDFAIDYYNYSAGEGIANRENYSEVFGLNYLDTTKKPAFNYGVILFLAILFVVVAYIYNLVIKTGRKKLNLTKRTLEKYQDLYLMDVDVELNIPDIINFGDQKLYFTENYLVCGINGLDVIPLNEINHVYGLTFKSFGKDKRSIIIDTEDGFEHEIACTRIDSKGEVINDQIMQYIINHLPDVRYGFEDGFYTEALSPFSTEALTADDEGGSKKNNYLSGVLGAFLWSLIGVLIWIAIGKFGFIAGIAGFLMMKFAIYGYQVFSGGINRKGRIISLVIAFLMIFVANYMLYVIEMSTYYYGNVFNIENIVKSVISLPDYLSFTELWGDFIKDLAIGYGLSIWSGLDIIKEVFKKKQEDLGI